MKKLILTETQLDYLKMFLLLEENGNEDGLKEFVKSIKNEFVSNIGKHNIGNYVTFAFGEVEKDGKWQSDGLQLITFKILDVEDGGVVRLKFVTSEGPKTKIDGLPEDSVLTLYSKGNFGFHFSKQKPSVGFNVDKDIIKIPNFLSYIITPKEEKTTALAAAEKAQSNWLEKNRAFNKKMIYEPSFLGMDNFFFFPRGYMAMDDILKKFGLNVDGIGRMKIKIRNNDVVGDEEFLRKNGEYSGVIKNNKIIIPSNDETFLFYIGKNKLVRDGNFTLDTSYRKQNGEEIPIDPTEIKVLKM
jgi:hypothetical protein